MVSCCYTAYIAETLIPQRKEIKLDQTKGTKKKHPRREISTGVFTSESNKWKESVKGQLKTNSSLQINEHR